MERVRRAAIVSRLVEQLRSRGSWCGETHVQKATYFLQELLKVPLDFDFVLYKHGPFSFDLRDELTSLRADSILTLKLCLPYGPRIASTEQATYIQGVSSKTIAKYEKSIEFVAEKLGKKDVVDLERLGTALYVLKGAPERATLDRRTSELTRLKPHIGREEAGRAIEEVDQIVEELSVLE